MAREPGRKFRTEEILVDGREVTYEVRTDDDGRFFTRIGDEILKADSFAELKQLAEPVIRTNSALEFDPFIEIEYLEGKDHSRYSYDSGTEMVSLRFGLVWRSRVPTSTNRHDTPVYTGFNGEVDKETFLPVPLKERVHTRRLSMWHSLPFSKARWQQLTAIQQAIIAARKRIAEVVGDDTGAKLDAMAGVPLLVSAKK